jgi:hypothetical protein
VLVIGFQAQSKLGWRPQKQGLQPSTKPSPFLGVFYNTFAGLPVGDIGRGQLFQSGASHWLSFSLLAYGEVSIQTDLYFYLSEGTAPSFNRFSMNS